MIRFNEAIDELWMISLNRFINKVDDSTTGFQNQRLSDFNWWKEEYVALENMPIKESVV